MNKILISLLAIMLGGCSLIPKPDVNLTDAEVNPVSDTMKELKAKPGPKHAIPVAVYSFRDQTGQYKPQANVSSFSTAVTQGATSMLVQTLLDSGWFSPVEREGLQNLLTERKITNKNKGKDELPALTDARLLIEGGIIAYETNINTGGSGLGYYGISASELFREDQVTIYLRAVDVYTGKVMMSVSTTKRVFSQEMRAGLFRYISFKELAEAEIGFTTNEPVQFCVLSAIELAVSELVQQGIDKGFWRTGHELAQTRAQTSPSQAQP